MINWDTTKTETETINKIADRAIKLNISNDRMSLNMDITACHLNGCRLKLNDLLEADNFNFIHDIQGIQKHIDRNTGILTHCFLPRYSK